jgi:hypothetical protein
MSRFVESNPEPEFRRPELKPPFHRKNVGTDEHDGVTLATIAGGQNKFVLAENTTR